MPWRDAIRAPSRRRNGAKATALALALLIGGVLAPAARPAATAMPVGVRVGPAPGRPSADSDTPSAELLVDFGDGRLSAWRLPVAPTTTGLDLLRAADLDLVENGGAVCALGGVGCPAARCFCDARVYWAYHHGALGGGWRYATEGPAQHRVSAGDLEGWAWGAGRPPVTTTVASRAVLRAVEWLQSRQLPDGSQAGSPGLTAEHVLAARAAGVDPNAPTPGGLGALDYLRANADHYSAEGVAAAGKLAVAVAAAGEDPRGFGGVDLPVRVRRPGDDAVHLTVWDAAWGMLGLVANGTEVPATWTAALMAHPAAGGGWGFLFSADEADPDSTGLALEALAAAGVPRDAPAVTAALAWLDAHQSSDGGWPHDPGDTSNANSTAYAAQGIVAAGEDPTGPRWTTTTQANPVTYLASLQRPDGRFAFDASPADLVATLQVTPALAGRPAPQPGRAVAARRALTWIATQRTPEGGYQGFNPGATVDAVLALAAHGRDANAPAPSGRNPSDYLATVAADYAGRGASAAGKLLAGAVALGADPRAFGGVDLVAAVEATRNVTGTYGTGGTWDTAWAMLGLAGAGTPVPRSATLGLAAAASPAGGWGFGARALVADVDSTGLALQALAAGRVDPADPDAGAVAAAMGAGVDFLRGQRDPSGAFLGDGDTASAASTGLALGGLVAAGQDVQAAGWLYGPVDALPWYTPVAGLVALQSPRGGFAGYSGPDDPGATYAAVLGLALRPLPIVPVGRDGRWMWLPALARP
jgi:hypothetical protein